MRRAVVALMCAVMAAAAPAPAHAQAPTNGQLAVVLGNRIVAVNPDGTGQRPLYTPSGGGTISGPAWSPDGNKLAFSYQDKITVIDLASGTRTSLTTPGAGARDVDAAWLADGTIGFRRITIGALGLEKQERMKVTLAGAVLSPRALDVGLSALAFGPSFDTYAFRLGTVLDWSGSRALELSLGATDTPAWSPAGTDLAYVETGLGSVWAGGLRVISKLADSGPNLRITELPAAAPRWSPDGKALTFLRDGRVQTVPAVKDSTAAEVPGLSSATAVDWQPCVGGVTLSCRSVLPPVCSATAPQVATQADQPVEIPVASCTDPANLPLRFVLDKDGEHGSVTGTTYTPRPGFTGQDTIQYRMSNGTAESELVKVTVFVVPRPAAVGPPPVAAPPPAPAAAPFLSLRVKPRLDRKRSVLARLTCDQPCTFAVRLEGTLRAKPKKAVKGATITRTLAPGRVLAVRLKLPARPKGALKRIWITGTVRNATGATRAVRLPVSPPR
ncbi:PD40 domain-containing protein [Solirubrobacter sp. CPCC 204708]|uniref:Ig-like domain-containing protein n=1 Tax=Solirubrobacter deserti TaxID=2282478 RepID=A0ABT4RNS4_9ACTN|nr:Ig-like domain-containing protein [Solirubrobacter deserti]MBE2319210.1 PD40 domain-containing protein [Solirubrobacter deserti]MDA0140216.1 Ig-like domain-containing protein [Solirubrobacter deserti]